MKGGLCVFIDVVSFCIAFYIIDVVGFFSLKKRKEFFCLYSPMRHLVNIATFEHHCCSKEPNDKAT